MCVSDMNVRNSREPYCDDAMDSVTSVTENTIPTMETIALLLVASEVRAAAVETAIHGTRSAIHASTGPSSQVEATASPTPADDRTPGMNQKLFLTESHRLIMRAYMADRHCGSLVVGDKCRRRLVGQQVIGPALEADADVALV